MIKTQPTHYDSPPCHPSSSFVENAVKLESALFGSALGCMNDWMDGLIDGMIDF